MMTHKYSFHSIVNSFISSCWIFIPKLSFHLAVREQTARSFKPVFCLTGAKSFAHVLGTHVPVRWLWRSASSCPQKRWFPSWLSSLRFEFGHCSLSHRQSSATVRWGWLARGWFPPRKEPSRYSGYRDCRCLCSQKDQLCRQNNNKKCK